MPVYSRLSATLPRNEECPFGPYARWRLLHTTFTCASEGSRVQPVLPFARVPSRQVLPSSLVPSRQVPSRQVL